MIDEEMKGTEDYDDEVYADHFRQPEDAGGRYPEPEISFRDLCNINELLKRPLK